MIRKGVPVPEEFNHALRGWRLRVYRVTKWVSYAVILILIYYGFR